METHIWKTVYYQVIEMLKSAYLDTENTTAENRKTLKSCLINLFDEGVDYYTQLLTDLATQYRFVVDQLLLCSAYFTYQLQAGPRPLLRPAGAAGQRQRPAVQAGHRLRPEMQPLPG